MDVYNTEEQQIKAIKEWWGENGTSIIVGIVIGLSGFFGYQWWQNKSDNDQKTASQAYATVLEINAKEKPEEFLTSAKAFKDSYKDSSYAILASLHIVKQLVEKNELEAAETEMKWALGQAKGTEIESVLSIRLARVLNAREKHEEAKKLLEAIKPDAYKGLVQQVLGDTYFALGDKEKAQAAYVIAKESTDSYVAKNELEMLVDDLTKAEAIVETATSDVVATTEEASKVPAVEQEESEDSKQEKEAQDS